MPSALKEERTGRESKGDALQKLANPRTISVQTLSRSAKFPDVAVTLASRSPRRRFPEDAGPLASPVPALTQVRLSAKTKAVHDAIRAQVLFALVGVTIAA